MKTRFMLIRSGGLMLSLSAAFAAQSLPAGQPAGPVTQTQAPTVLLIQSGDTIRDLGAWRS